MALKTRTQYSFRRPYTANTEFVPEILLPAFHRFPVQRLRGQLRQLNPNSIWSIDIGQDRLGRTRANVFNLGTTLLEHRRSRRHIIHNEAKVIDSCRFLRIRRLYFNERVLADLNINERNIPLIVLRTERLGKTQCFRVIVHGFVQVRNDDADVIQADDSLIRTQVLGQTGLDSKPDDNSCNEQKCTTHKQLLYLLERCEVSFSFSQTQSRRSVSGTKSHGIVAVHGFLYALGSSIVSCTCICPKSNRRKRSIICKASLCGWPVSSSQVFSFRPTVSTTNVSPSHLPTE